ncbi:hypothetical protein PV325_006935 [Microctonus aethiopoides]|nr:hypothetical protein PV325_006935 [Microctonus aethiopoides]KAK0091986.1 hypothetical protein PV326_002410 [Microctonus aethiopoides]
MSYGYQGPPYPGQKPPTSFGAPPGAPSAPCPSDGSPYPSNSNFGFSNQPPTSFGMPQPFSPYPTSSFQPQPTPYTPYPTQPSGPSPYPTQSGGPSPYPTQPGGQSPYPTQSGGPSPYPTQSGGPSPYPTQPGGPSPYPTQCPAPYPPQSQYPPQFNQSSPYPRPQPNYQSYSPHQQHNPYPNPSANPSYNARPPSSMNTSYPPNANIQSANAYSGNAYPGGQGREGLYPSIPGPKSAISSYNAPAPRKNAFKPKLSPTAVPYPDFDPRADAEILRKAMKGFGTDEKAIINVLANRSNLQRQEIAVQFKTLYGKDMIKDLKSELSGNFENLVIAMVTPLPQYYAKELHEAMSGIGTDECVLIEVMCTMSNHEIHVIRQAYEAMYGKSLEDDLREDTSGNFKRLMISLCCGNRDESFDVDQAGAMEDARRLLQAGELRFGTDESTFNAILVSRNIPQLKQIFTEYHNITGHSIQDAIENEFTGDIKKGLLAIVKCVNNRAAFFAEQLYKSMKGMGTDDRRLIRLIVTRSEIDLGEIKQVFAAQYGKSLEEYISSECSGHYKKCLLALIA